MPKHIPFQRTDALRKAARAVDALCGCGGKTDARTMPKANLFVAYIGPVLARAGFTAVVPFSAAELDDHPAVVARFVLQDAGETLIVDVLHVQGRGELFRNWIPAERAAMLDLSGFMPLAA